MTQTIINGGPFDVQVEYTGPVGEVTYDLSNWDLLLHDGATQGGHRLLARANADSRYQIKNGELDGFSGIGPQLKGFWVRRAPGDFRLRTLTVNGANLEITDGNGFAGNPYIELAPIIESEHVWNGQQQFNDVVEFTTGIIGDIEGTHYGNVEGNVVGNLTGNSTGIHTGPQVGDVDVRGETLLLDDDQIPQSAVSGLSEALTGLEFPTGGIILWSGDSSDIPSGWVICDGDNGTPDLRGSFVLGATAVGDGIEAHSTGGAETHNHTIELAASGTHSHTGTVAPTILDLTQIPSHKHGSGVTDNSTTDVFNHGNLAASPTTGNSIESNSADGIYEGYTSNAGGGLGHDHSMSTEDNGSHTHDVTPAAADHIPPYYAICYIMRLAS